VLLYETRRTYALSLASALDNLRLKYRLVTDQSGLLEALTEADYTHLIMPASAYPDFEASLKPNLVKVRIALTGEYAQTMTEGNICYLLLPAYSRTIADFINDTTELSNNNDAVLGCPDFMMPRAHILLVDDLEINLMVAEGLLIPYAAQVDLCQSGFESVALVKENEYDLVFMDHMMPDLDGIEATRRIRALVGERFQKLPIIALTANAVPGQRAG
jgi:CheY-like chemotaxis protein